MYHLFVTLERFMYTLHYLRFGPLFISFSDSIREHFVIENIKICK